MVTNIHYILILNATMDILKIKLINKNAINANFGARNVVVICKNALFVRKIFYYTKINALRSVLMERILMVKVVSLALKVVQNAVNFHLFVIIVIRKTVIFYASFAYKVKL